MTQQLRTIEGDTVDLIAWRVARVTKGFTELILAANPGLAARGPVLPEGLFLTIPDVPKPKTVTTTRRLWN